MPTSSRKEAVPGPVRDEGQGPPSGEIEPSAPIELVVLAMKQRGARCRLLGSGQVITLRAGNLHRIVSGQIVRVQPAKRWKHAGHPYLSGQVIDARIDAAALGLLPLELVSFETWDPAHEYWREEGEPLEEWAERIIARGPRPAFEMEQVLPGTDDADFDSDPILESNERKDAGDIAGAQELLEQLLEADLRCLDAHAHLGNLVFHHSPQWACHHYEVGVRIGELSLGDGFEGVLPWGLIDNRPFLRCMHGFGLCLWRMERWEDAARVFDQMLWLTPSDNLGVRSLLPAVQAREPWSADEERPPRHRLSRH
jgi:hypothetical protein